ncbi:MAG: Tm-1-like ATP-binding domain-containing protein [Rhizobiales bacterium]|nr:Tm-1-like ATP-binding domain-containing protein [Hyphomicrobiales bacterium]
MAEKTVAIIGTLDTKAAEFAFLKRAIEDEGVGTLLIDAGILADPPFAPDVGARELASAAGADLATLRAARDRGPAVTAMADGAAATVTRLQAEGRIHGIIGMGGGGGTSIAARAMRALPVGFPKLIVSTLAAGDISPYVGVKDIMMMPSIVDIAGINRLSSEIMANAAGAIAGMVKAKRPGAGSAKPLVAATMFGVTTPCVTKARAVLEDAGYEVLVFHATGTGGRTMEELVRAGFVEGVLDITTTELADELAGGVLSAGPDRLTAAGEKGIPQVVSSGALDMVNFGAPETVPARYASRLFYRHNPQVTLMRTTVEENAALGRILAEKLNAASGPTTFILPKGGVSAIDLPGKPFHDPEADAAFIRELKANLGANVTLVERDADINDEAFATEAANLLIAMLKEKRGGAAAP